MNNPSPEHQKLVGALINYFKNTLGFKILDVVYNDYPRPTEHGGYIPDIVAIDNKENGVNLFLIKRRKIKLKSAKIR